MDKTKRLAKESIMLSMDSIKQCMESTANEDRLLKFSECMAYLALAYRTLE